MLIVMDTSLPCLLYVDLDTSHIIYMEYYHAATDTWHGEDYINLKPLTAYMASDEPAVYEVLWSSEFCHEDA